MLSGHVGAKRFWEDLGRDATEQQQRRWIPGSRGAGRRGSPAAGQPGLGSRAPTAHPRTLQGPVQAAGSALPNQSRKIGCLGREETALAVTAFTQN